MYSSWIFASRAGHFFETSWIQADFFFLKMSGLFFHKILNTKGLLHIYKVLFFESFQREGNIEESLSWINNHWKNIHICFNEFALWLLWKANFSSYWPNFAIQAKAKILRAEPGRAESKPSSAQMHHYFLYKATFLFRLLLLIFTIIFWFILF